MEKGVKMLVEISKNTTHLISYIFSRNRSIVEDHNKNSIKLWDNQSELHGYVNSSLLNFKPIDDLFEIID